ncbi:MAG: hypothetical protein AAF289_05875 [Cyanobacteria bacterium P01_A01_bin.135]
MTRSPSGLSFTQLPSLTIEIRCQQLPLAVYREVSCHLRQCSGVDVEILPQPAAKFRYGDSQAGGLRLRYQPDIDHTNQQQVEAILRYYGDRYGAWELIGEPH